MLSLSSIYFETISEIFSQEKHNFDFDFIFFYFQFFRHGSPSVREN